MQPALLDTDILSALMRRRELVVQNAERYPAIHQRFTISIITRYEILRGLEAKKAQIQLAVFNSFALPIEFCHYPMRSSREQLKYMVNSISKVF